MERRVSQRSGLWFFQDFDGLADTLGVQDFFEDGELQALLDIIGVNHGAENGAESFGAQKR